MKSGELHVPATLSLEKEPFLAIGQEGLGTGLVVLKERKTSCSGGN